MDQRMGIRKGFLKGSVITVSRVVLIFQLVSLVSCTNNKPPVKGDHPSLQWHEAENRPKTVVIMPFENNTTEEEIVTLVRDSFYSQFCAKNFRDLELRDVDRALKMIEQNTSRSWKELTPRRIGDVFDADFVIYGKVHAYRKFFIGIYAQIALEVSIEMVQCRSGEGVWQKTLTKRSHDGGVPFDLFGIVPAAVRSGLHMKKERTIQLIDQLNRELVEMIPEPPFAPVSAFLMDVQVASFVDIGKADKAIDQLKKMGLKPRMVTAILSDRRWYRVVLGPYYQRSAAERDRDMIQKQTSFKPIFMRYTPEAKQEKRGQIKEAMP